MICHWRTMLASVPLLHKILLKNPFCILWDAWRKELWGQTDCKEHKIIFFERSSQVHPLVKFWKIGLSRTQHFCTSPTSEIHSFENAALRLTYSAKFFIILMLAFYIWAYPMQFALYLFNCFVCNIFIVSQLPRALSTKHREMK